MLRKRNWFTIAEFEDNKQLRIPKNQIRMEYI